MNRLSEANFPFVHPMPGQEIGYVAAFGGSDDLAEFGEDITPVDTIDEANVITSRLPVEGIPEGVHRPIIDLDLRAWIEPSSTPGHGHLYIDHAMTWEVYKHLLEALRASGLISEGYLDAALKRQCTVVRLPWVKKGEPRAVPEPFPAPEPAAF